VSDDVFTVHIDGAGTIGVTGHDDQGAAWSSFAGGEPEKCARCGKQIESGWTSGPA
jgi:hypothetical protein